MKESWRIRDCSMEEAFQSIYRCSQVATRVPFIFFAEKVCVENVLSREKIRQNLLSLRRKNRSRNPAVLLPDLLLVFGESLFSLTKNSEIHIDDEGLVRTGFCFVVLGGHDQLPHTLDECFWKLGLDETRYSQFCAPFLVVACLRLIHHIVKPQREFRRIRLPCQMACPVEFRQALRDVLLIVIVPMRLAVGSSQSMVPWRRIAGCTRFAPKCHPPRFS